MPKDISAYTYDATGIKLSKEVVSVDNFNIPVVTTYTGNYIYEDATLKFITHPEGYIEPDGAGGYDYVYQYKDHLGNTSDFRIRIIMGMEL